MTKFLSSARVALMVGLLAVVALIAAACGGADPTATPTATPKPADGGSTEPTATPEPVDFAGKSVRITVGFAPGGGFDTFARVFAVHLQKTLPGNPKVVVSNLPGANTLRFERRSSCFFSQKKW
jgi:tripartite-type tricarboxylate transporter receptor subunit TctC